tara:strand:+ start:21498 stop:21884 length:387 start_codon:yes stop_codon:yes gene_type:complete
MSDTPSEHLSAIKLLAAIAWADGEMQEQERVALNRIVSVAIFKEGERELAQGYVANPTELDLSATAKFDEASREGIYRAAIRCAAADGVLHPSETAMLLELRKGLALRDALADSIEHESFPDGLATED